MSSISEQCKSELSAMVFDQGYFKVKAISERKKVLSFLLVSIFTTGVAFVHLFKFYFGGVLQSPSFTDELHFAFAKSETDLVPLRERLSERLELNLFPNDDLLAAKRV